MEFELAESYLLQQLLPANFYHTDTADLRLLRSHRNFSRHFTQPLTASTILYIYIYIYIYIDIYFICLMSASSRLSAFKHLHIYIIGCTHWVSGLPSTGIYTSSTTHTELSAIQHLFIYIISCTREFQDLYIFTSTAVSIRHMNTLTGVLFSTCIYTSSAAHIEFQGYPAPVHIHHQLYTVNLSAIQHLYIYVHRYHECYLTPVCVFLSDI